MMPVAPLGGAAWLGNCPMSWNTNPPSMVVSVGKVIPGACPWGHMIPNFFAKDKRDPDYNNDPCLMANEKFDPNNIGGTKKFACKAYANQQFTGVSTAGPMCACRQCRKKNAYDMFTQHSWGNIAQCYWPDCDQTEMTTGNCRYNKDSYKWDPQNKTGHWVPGATPTPGYQMANWNGAPAGTRMASNIHWKLANCYDCDRGIGGWGFTGNSARTFPKNVDCS